MDELERLQKRLAREKTARAEAESLLEQKSYELYTANTKLSELAKSLEEQVIERTQDLTLALQKAQSATNAKSEFLSTMSHEIRTPLNGVLGMTQLLEDTKLNKTQKEYVQTIQSSGNALLTLINDILDLSKIESGKMHLEKKSINIRETFHEVLSIFAVQSEVKGVTLKKNLKITDEESIIADPTRIKQILFNLVGNALKFTQKGEITVSLEKEEIDSNKNLYICKIKDSGIGIERDKLEKLFKPFSQVDSSTTRKFGGTGLGLVICKKLVGLMNGDITVISQSGIGSTFTFSFEGIIEKVKLQCIEKEATEKIKSDLKILIAEDNSINQKVLSFALKKLGLNSTIVDNGAKAVEEVKINKYDIIFMDMQMPELNGIDATKEIRKLPINQPTIVALTANAFKEDKDNCIEAGMDDFLSKPFTNESLEKILKSIK